LCLSAGRWINPPSPAKNGQKQAEKIKTKSIIFKYLMPVCPIKQYVRPQGKAKRHLETRMPFNGAQNVRHRLKGAMLSVVLFVLVMNVCALSAPQDVNQPIRVRIFNMRNITAQQAKDYLAQVQVADAVVIIPGTTAVSVTASPEQLVYATSILKLVDSNESYEIQLIDIEPDKKLPKNDDIQTKLGKGFSVGTLLEGPIASVAEKIIVDNHNDKILIISPKGQTANVVKTIQEMLTFQKEPSTAPVTSEVNAVQPAAGISKPNEPKTEDKVLGEFMNELSETAKKEPTAKKVVAEPNLTKPALTQKQQQSQKPQPLQEVSEPAQQNPAAVFQETEISNGDELLDLNLPEKLEIVNLIDLVGRYLKLNYLYDETKVNGSVTVKVQGKIRVRELYSLLESVLKFRGFVMSRKGNLVTIAPSAEALDQDPRLVDGVAKPGDVVVTKVFHLEHISTASARKLLGEMKLGSSITEIPETGTLVITEYAFRIQRIEDLLNLVDVPGPPKEYKLRVLKYTIAESLVTKIKALAEQLGTVEVTIGTTSSPVVAEPGGRIRPRPVTTPQPGQPQQSTAAKGTGGVFIDFDKRTNRVLMIGLTSEITAVDKIIDSLDVPQQDLRVIREYEIQYVDITKVVDALKEFDIVTAVGTTAKPSGARTTTGPPGAQPQPAAALEAASQGGGAAIDQPQVITLESTNSLLVNATPEQHIQISRIISYVDREPVQAAIPYKIYRLENQEPEKMAEVLNGLIEKTVKDKEGKIQQTVKYTEENIAIVPDKGTFSLIVYASRKNQEWIGNLIKSLDRRRPQVLIDVSLVEITQDNEFNYDLDVLTTATNVVANNIGITGSVLTGAPGTTGATLPFPSTSPRKTLLEGGYFDTAGNTRGFYNNGKIQALLSLMDKKGYGRVLARPKILVNDNEKGTISTENTTYISQQTNATLPGTTTGTTTTTSDTVLVSQNYTPYTAKIELDITPQISEGDLLRLEIKMQRSDFITGQSGSTSGPPDQKSSNVDTIVTVPDGSTIILGGLIKLNQSKGGNKVPGFGDMPIIGALFRTYNKTQNDDKLYIFVKANIIRPEDAQGINQIKQISRKNRDEFERDETAFQQYQEIPGIKAPPVDPNHVLNQ
jgi:type II secretory pathway component GspD/PulD (secretin)